jgi:hypothetical protein
MTGLRRGSGLGGDAVRPILLRRAPAKTTEVSPGKRPMSFRRKARYRAPPPARHP